MGHRLLAWNAPQPPAKLPWPNMALVQKIPEVKTLVEKSFWRRVTPMSACEAQNQDFPVRRYPDERSIRWSGFAP